MAFTRNLILTAAIAAIAAPVWAGGHGGNPAVTARQSHMQLYQHNLIILGNMAKGDVDYDADAAQAAANNIVALVNLSQAGYWPQGSDNGALGDVTRAKPDLWQNYPDVIEKAGAVKAAAEALAMAASNGQAALGPAVGALGGACTECHKSFRASSN